MTLAEKLRFIADRAEDGKAFLVDDVVYVLDDNALKTGDVVSIEINKIKFADLKHKPTWEFTEDEKVILRNLEDKWKWIARDEDGKLWLYNEKPYRMDDIWALSTSGFSLLWCFSHLFQSVKWEDDEPCEFREYI